MTQNDDFWRLAQGLRAMKIDFNYAETRKLLDPKWDGYIIDNMDVEKDDCPLVEANLLTSQHRDDTTTHSIVLDLDYGGDYLTLDAVTRLRLKLNSIHTARMEERLLQVLARCGLPKARVTYPVAANPCIPRSSLYTYPTLEIDTTRDFALIPSSTPLHRHLILDCDLSWPGYIELLQTLAASGLIQAGYARASIKRGYSAIRPPWVRK